MDGCTGYGQHVLYTADWFRRAGYVVGIEPTRCGVGGVNTVPELTVAKVGHPHLLIEPSDWNEPSDYWFTMYETTKLPWDAFQRLNKARHIIVPCEWNAVCFNAQGLAAQVHVCPLGVNHARFRPLRRGASSRFVFGMFGTPSYSNVVRKNFAHAVQAFGAAFGGRKDVHLQIKQLPSCPTIGFDRPGVEVIAESYTEEQIALWLQSIDVLVMPSRCEAFGFTALQAMACGKPVIACAFAGPASYLTAQNAFLVDYTLVPARGAYMETGLWAEPDFDSTVAAMVSAVSDTAQLEAKGREAAKTAACYSWSAYGQRLQSILQTTGFFENKVRPSIHKPAIKIEGARISVDDIVRFYADHPGSSKPKFGSLFDPEKYTLTNTPTGMGDSVMMTDLPRAAALARRSGSCYLSSTHFRDIIQYNPYYVDKHHPVWLSLSSMQIGYDLGPGHNFQKTRRMFGLPVDPRPSGCIIVPGVEKRNRVSLHFEPGVHANAQRVIYHPRAREVYPENLNIIRQFIAAHPELEFFEVGGTVLADTVPNIAHLPLPSVVREMASCSLHLGIISGPYHIANALGVRTIVIINFPHPSSFMLPCMKNVDVVESEWLYPQSHVLHQDEDSAHWPKFSLKTLEMAYHGETYPYEDPTPFLQLVNK